MRNVADLSADPVEGTHENHTVQADEHFIAEVYEAMKKNPTLWRESIALSETFSFPVAEGILRAVHRGVRNQGCVSVLRGLAPRRRNDAIRRSVGRL